MPARLVAKCSSTLTAPLSASATPDVGQAEPLGVRIAAGGVEHLVGDLDTAVAHRHAKPLALAVDALDMAGGAQIDPLLAHLDGHEAGDLGIEAAQDLLAAVELRDLRPQAAKDRREFAGDVATADDQQVLRKGRQVENLVRRDRQVGTGEHRHHRVATGRDHELAGRVARTVHLDLAGADDPSPAADDLHAGVFEQLAVDRVQAADLGRPVFLEQLPVEHRRPVVVGRPAEAGRFFIGLGIVRGVAVEFFRDAAQVDAGATERCVFGDRHPGTVLRRHARRPNATAAGADDEEVEGRVAHAGFPERQGVGQRHHKCGIAGDFKPPRPGSHDRPALV